MDSKTRLTATRYIWTAFFFALLIVNGSVIFNADAFDLGNLIATIVVAVTALSATGFVWNWGSLPTTATYEEGRGEKAKRRARVEGMLDLLTDDELEDLRERLSERADSDTMMLTEEGELVRRRR